MFAIWNAGFFVFDRFLGGGIEEPNLVRDFLFGVQNCADHGSLASMVRARNPVAITKYLSEFSIAFRNLGGVERLSIDAVAPIKYHDDHGIAATIFVRFRDIFVARADNPTFA